MNKIGTLLKSLLVSYILTGLLLLLLALLLYKGNPSKDVIRAGIIFAYIFSSFIGGFIMGKKMRVQKFLWGILLGITYFVVIFAVSMIMNQSIVGPGMQAITVFIMCSLGGMMGGMLS